MANSSNNLLLFVVAFVGIVFAQSAIASDVTTPTEIEQPSASGQLPDVKKLLVKDEKTALEPMDSNVSPAKTATKETKKSKEKSKDKAKETVKQEAKEPEQKSDKPEEKAKEINGDDKLKSALEYVYTNHPQLKAQREALKVADEGVAQAVSGFRPNASANVVHGRERGKTATQDWNYDDTKSRSLTVTQPIFSGGSSVAGFMTAKEKVKAERAKLSTVEQQILFDAVVAYTDVVEKQSVLELNQNNVDVLKEQMDVTNARFKVGELTITDVSQSKARLAQAEADERQALGNLEAAKATFRRVIGYDSEEKVAMPTVPAGIPQSLVEAKDIAQAASPVLMEAKHNEKAADNNIYVNSSTLLPKVDVQGTMARSESNVITNLGKIENDSVKLNVSIPLYQSGAEWSRIREARNLANQAKFSAMDANESVMESVSLAWEAYNTSKAVIASNEVTVSAAETALEGVRKEHEFGVRTILDVLNAEQEKFIAKVNLVKAVRSEKIQAYRLLGTMGKLTSKELGLKTDVPNPEEHYDSVKYQLLGL